MNETLLPSPALEHFQDELTKETSLVVEGLWEAPKAALLSLIFKKTGKPLVVVTTETRETRLLDDLDYFGKPPTLEFPSWETLPEEEIDPSLDIVGKRFEILNTLSSKAEPHILLCPLQAILQKLPKPGTLAKQCYTWKAGDEIPMELIVEILKDLGYRQEVVTSDKGEFSVRGGLIDLFPVSGLEPYRLDFFGDTIEQIRTFDPSSQKTTGKVPSLFLSPSSETSFSKEADATLLDYIQTEPYIIFDDIFALEDRYVALKKSDSLLTFKELLLHLQNHQTLYFTRQKLEELSEITYADKPGRGYYSGKTPLQSLSFQAMGETIASKRWHHPFIDIPSYFSPLENEAASSADELFSGIARQANTPLSLTFLTQTAAEEQKLKGMLETTHTPLPKMTIFEKGYLTSGFAFSDAPFALFPMTDLTKRYKTRRTKWRASTHTPAAEFHELQPGDLVVHFHSGIGKYLGTEKRTNHLGQETEFMVLEYAKESKLFVPVAQSYLVSRYIGSQEDRPTLNILGTNKWQKAKEKTQQAILGYAQDLLKMQASRDYHGGFAFPEDTEETLCFEDDFPFEETNDQKQAIADIKREMTSDKAMDRLICGDVGYGKTEVAMRAAFKTVADGKKQVAVLVPTTVLAMQHHDTFVARMANFPINIAAVSRLCTPKQAREILEKVKTGAIDILIGTHRLLSKDIIFKDLGLLIIDEEQRFGVRAKEHLKKLKSGVDCLTLTATPIPRTLYMSLIGAREISTINTPPFDRLPIKTILAERDPTIIKNALERELARDGQAFFLHNRVETIYKVSEEIQQLLPEAKIVVGHGQMSSEQLDTIFHTFKSGHADILISTTIIESGVDIPNANTILIDRADCFGIADLYQLRGRVGRWNRPAYAYFLVPPRRELPEIARKRLNALVEASGFGGGMKIAMRDLEIRGAGDILGTQQSGHVSSVGFHLYCKLLKRAIGALKNKTAPTFTETKLEFPYDAKLPEDYINAPSLRMELYNRLGEAMDPSEVDTILDELKDRFGPPPEPVLWLYHMARIRIAANKAKLSLLKIENFSFTLQKPKSGKQLFPMIRSKDPQAVEDHIMQVLQKL